MAKNKQNFSDRYTDEVIVKVKGGTRTADLIERLEKDEIFSKVTTPEDIKKVVKFYVAQAINSMEDDAKLYTVKPEDIESSNIAVLSHLKRFRDGLCSAKQFVNKLVDDMTLREQRDSMNRIAESLGRGGFNGIPNPTTSLMGMGMLGSGMMGINRPVGANDSLTVMNTFIQVAKGLSMCVEPSDLTKDVKHIFNEIVKLAYSATSTIVENKAKAIVDAVDEE